jgi:hypothetical protein
MRRMQRRGGGDERDDGDKRKGDEKDAGVEKKGTRRIQVRRQGGREECRLEENGDE